MPKRTYEETTVPDPDTDMLQDISVLFIPFDAAGKFYKDNSRKGVHGFTGTLDRTGARIDSVNRKRALLPSRSTDHFLEGTDIATELSRIVQQECELVRNMHRPDTKYEENLDLLAKAQRPFDDPSTWSEHWKARVKRNLKGYKHYPTLIFLSENPTGKAFPDRIDTEIGTAYVKKLALDGATITGIKQVNQMAVYLRADIDARINDSLGAEDALFLEAKPVTRSTHALYKGGKDEYILEVTIGRRAGHSFTVAGVHLRADLTGVTSSSSRLQELAALQTFCDGRGIQLMVGDFNLDLQVSDQGNRGVYFDLRPENQPRFLLDEHSTEAIPEYVQQYSNSTGNKHYMGYFQADTATLRLTGPSVYGLMGASGSRSLQGGGEYYSDHPSIYVCVKSERLLPEADKAITMRKIARIMPRPLKKRGIA